MWNRRYLPAILAVALAICGRSLHAPSGGRRNGRAEPGRCRLSGGQRQRVAVARSLADDPPVVLADEPTGSLDSKSSEQVFTILETLVRERGKTVVAVTHDLGMAERMDRRLHLVDGRIESETRSNTTADGE